MDTTEKSLAVIIPELDKIIQNSGIQLNEGEIIKQSYLPYFNQLAEIKELAKKINFETPGEFDEGIAKQLRLRVVKIRTGSEAIKDEQKKLDLLRGSLKQSTWNLLRDTCKLEEEAFLQVEKRREIEEKLRVETIHKERSADLMSIGYETNGLYLGNLDEQTYEALKAGFQKQIDDKKQAEILRIENENKQKLKNKREIELAPFVQFVTGEKPDLAEISQEVWEAFIQSLRKADKEHKAEQEKIKQENERLKKEAEEREAKVAEEKRVAIEERDKKLKLAEAEIKRVRDVAEKAALIEKEKQEAEAKRTKEESDRKEKMGQERGAKLSEIGLSFDGDRYFFEEIKIHWTDIISLPDAEFNELYSIASEMMGDKMKLKKSIEAERDKAIAKDKADKKILEDKLKLKQEEEDKAKREAAELIEKNALKGDSEKFEDFINEMEELKSKYSFESNKYKALYESASEYLTKIINHLTAKK